MITKQCPNCKKEVEYVEFECDQAFTAPAELRFKALNVWGVYDAAKEVICYPPGFVHFKFLGSGKERLVKMLGFDREAFYQNLQELQNKKQPCEHTDEAGKSICENEGNPVFSMFNPDEPIGYFCDGHCFENGACRGCYQFLAGWESFDFSESGLCAECEEEQKRDFSEGRDDDDYDYGDDYL